MFIGQIHEGRTFQEVKEELKQKKFTLQGDGFIQFMDCMGGDADIVAAARTTTDTSGKSPEEDVGLLRYMARHRHTTPTEMVELKFLVKVAMDTWRQWIRHRQVSVNEYSTRYSEAIDTCQRVEPDAWRTQSQGNRQGSAGFLAGWPEGFVADGATKGEGAGTYFTRRQDELLTHAREVYDERLRAGIANEQARKDLPLSTHTLAVWKIDAHNLLHFLGLRMDSHAQQEIREYANIIGNEIVAKLLPVTWQAFLDYRFNAVTLTALEQQTLLSVSTMPMTGYVFSRTCPVAWRGLKRCRERDECLAKFARLGLITESQAEEATSWCSDGIQRDPTYG
jgi:thymidylate synthase (FAD)